VTDEVRLIPRRPPAVADYPAGSTFGPRDTRYFQFVWLLHGNAAWQSSDQLVRLSPGMLLLVQPGMRDYFEWDADRPTRHAYVIFTLPGTDRSHASGWPLVRLTGAAGNPLAGLCDYLIWLGEVQPSGWEQRTASTLATLVSCFVHGPLPDDGSPSLPDPIATMAGWVARSWSEAGIAHPVSLRDLAAATGTSPSTLSRAFRRQFGLGAVSALEVVRLARAEPLLTMSNLSIASIARQCGFADAYHFSRRFRANYELPPSDFRAVGPTRAPSPLVTYGLAGLARAVADSTLLPGNGHPAGRLK
jgi:AraC-like DNA-binding protein